MEEFMTVFLVVVSAVAAIFPLVQKMKKEVDVKFRKLDEEKPLVPDAADKKSAEVAEGQRMIKRNDAGPAAVAQTSVTAPVPACKFALDRKKLIIYSEIMKPKFDQ